MSHLLNAYCVPVTVLSALNILSYLILIVPQQGCYYFHFTETGLSLRMILQSAQGYTASKQLEFKHRRMDRTHYGINGESPFPTIESHCFYQLAVIKSF